MEITFGKTDAYEYTSISVYVDGEEAGYISVDRVGEYDAEIKYIEVFEKFRGQGLYVKLVRSVFQDEEFEDIDTLISDDRATGTSNDIYSKWLGVEVSRNEMITWVYDKWEDELKLVYSGIEVLK